MPSLSIITINKNNAAGLEKTIDSVLCQRFTDYEYIMIDGDSVDGSKNVVQQHSNRFSYWSSKPDRNVYHAMNKGIAEAKGEYCLFLNSGDCLSSSTSLSDAFSHQFSEDIVYCNDIACYPGGEMKNRYFPDHLNFDYLSRTSLPHQSSFIKTSVLKKFGGYNETFPLIADWEFYFKTLIIHNVSYKHLPIHLSIFDMSGIGTVEKFAQQRKDEWRAILYKHVPRIIDDYEKLKSVEKEYEELKKGIFRPIIKTILYLKKMKSNG